RGRYDDGWRTNDVSTATIHLSNRDGTGRQHEEQPAPCGNSISHGQTSDGGCESETVPAVPIRKHPDIAIHNLGTFNSPPILYFQAQLHVDELNAGRARDRRAAQESTAGVRTRDGIAAPLRALLGTHQRVPEPGTRTSGGCAAVVPAIELIPSGSDNDGA